MSTNTFEKVITNVDAIDKAVTVIDSLESESLGYTYGVNCFQINPESKSTPHSHQSSELWIVLSGTGVVFIDNSEITIEKGDRYVADGGKVHSIKNEYCEPLSILSLWWR